MLRITPTDIHNMPLLLQRTDAGTPLLQLRQCKILQHQPPLVVVVAVREAQLSLRPSRRLRLRVLLVPSRSSNGGGRGGGGGSGSGSQRAGRSGLQHVEAHSQSRWGVSGSTPAQAGQSHSPLRSGAGWAAKREVHWRVRYFSSCYRRWMLHQRVGRWWPPTYCLAALLSARHKMVSSD